jgi:hypothetical protein
MSAKFYGSSEKHVPTDRNELIDGSGLTGVDHLTALINVGTNTHAQIDTHIANVANPHTVTLEQARTAGNTLSGDVDMGGNTIEAVADPVAAQDAATKNYVDTTAAGRQFHESVRVATTADLSATYSGSPNFTLTAGSNGAITVDGVALSLNDRVLVKDEATQTDNGIYDVTTVGDGSNPFVLTRSSDYDSSSEIEVGDQTTATEGTTNAGKQYVMNNSSFATLDTDDITWVTVATGATDFDSIAPTTTKGDAIIHNGTTNVRLPVGTDDQIIVADSSTSTGWNWVDRNIVPVANIGVRRDSTQSGLSNDDYDAVIWDTEEFKNGAITFSASDTEVEVDEAGIYFITYSLCVNSGGDGFYIFFMSPNGNWTNTPPTASTDIRYGHCNDDSHTGSLTTTLTGTALVSLSATDYIETVAGQESATTGSRSINGATGTRLNSRFMMMRVA